MSKGLTDHWRKYYNVVVDGFGGYCTLCGNTGVIDTTTTARTPKGKLIGRKDYCICPNGQNDRRSGKKLT